MVRVENVYFLPANRIIITKSAFKITAYLVNTEERHENGLELDWLCNHLIIGKLLE